MHRIAARASLGGVLILTTVTTACSTTYMPRATGHVALVMDGGTIKYAKNGQTESLGFFGGGLVDAVTGNPVAEEEARTYRNLNVAGFTTTMVGAASAGAGLGLLVANSAQSQRDDAATSAGLALLLGGLVADVVGSFLMVGAQPHMMDALNIYNDGVDATHLVPTPIVYPGPYAPPMPPPAPPPRP